MKPDEPLLFERTWSKASRAQNTQPNRVKLQLWTVPVVRENMDEVGCNQA